MIRIEYRGIVEIISAVIGINEGYNHNNESPLNAQEICKIIQRLSEDYFNETNIYVPFVFKSCRTIYRTEWGCPEGGEITFEISTEADPERFVTPSQIREYNEHATILILRISEYFRQSTTKIRRTNSLIIKNVLK